MKKQLSLVKVTNLNRLLRSEIYVNEDAQLQVAHLILGYHPTYPCFQKGQDMMKAGD